MLYDFDCAGGRWVSIGQPSNVGRERQQLYSIFDMLPNQKRTLSERRISARRERFI